MYNYSLNLTYKHTDCDTVYRKELLDCFFLKSYTDKINDNIKKLFNDVNKHFSNVLMFLKKNSTFALMGELDDITCFTLLFSWEYLFDTHELLKSIFNNTDDIKDKETILLKTLESTLVK